MEKKYMMNMNAIEHLNPEKFDFLTKEVDICWFSGNNIPVVDVTTGKIYGSLILDNDSSMLGCSTLRNRVVEAITNNTALKAVKDYAWELKDLYGEDPTGHYFMDCGSVDLATLKVIWKNHKKREEAKKKETNKIERAKQILEEVDSLQSKINSLLKEAEKVLKG